MSTDAPSGPASGIGETTTARTIYFGVPAELRQGLRCATPELDPLMPKAG